MSKIPQIYLLFAYLLICFYSASSNMPPLDAKNNENERKNLPLCQACKALVKSFVKQMEKTARGKFEGGDSRWEEKSLKKYQYSEVRLAEIQENICKDVSLGQSQCYHLAETHEHLIENWWQNLPNEEVDLHTFLCIENIKACCPENHFGLECKPCPGNLTNPCSGRGRCKGAGTRKGSGQCSCDQGYAGALCENCKSGFYIDEDDSDCKKCDSSCKGHCKGSTPKDCTVCADGYRWTNEFGCGDIEECLESKPCKRDEFCANTYGSFICTKCHESCDGCTGDGADFCNKCAEDYILKDEFCIKYDTWKRTKYAVFTRYATYFGLSIATLIIFNKNSPVATIIGVFVAIYVGISEYTVKDEPNHLLGTPTFV